MPTYQFRAVGLLKNGHVVVSQSGFHHKHEVVDYIKNLTELAEKGATATQICDMPGFLSDLEVEVKNVARWLIHDTHDESTFNEIRRAAFENLASIRPPVIKDAR